MRRYWIDSNQLHGDMVTLVGEDYHHIVDVCRQYPPAKFEVITEDGTAFLVEMVQVTGGKKPSAQARVLETRNIPPLPRPHIHLVLSVCRFPVLEAILEKCVELGVHSVHLALSQYSFLKTEDKISPSRMERWHKIIRMATQQTGRGELMNLHPPQNLRAILNQSMNRNPQSMGLFLYEGEGGTTLRQTLAQKGTLKDCQDLWVIVGSEGGFSTQEVSHIKELGLSPITLGDQVLRVETACVSVISILKYELSL